MSFQDKQTKLLSTNYAIIILLNLLYKLSKKLCNAYCYFHFTTEKDK